MVLSLKWREPFLPGENEWKGTCASGADVSCRASWIVMIPRCCLLTARVAAWHIANPRMLVFVPVSAAVGVVRREISGQESAHIGPLEEKFAL